MTPRRHKRTHTAHCFLKEVESVGSVTVTLRYSKYESVTRNTCNTKKSSLFVGKMKTNFGFLKSLAKLMFFWRHMRYALRQLNRVESIFIERDKVASICKKNETQKPHVTQKPQVTPRRHGDAKASGDAVASR